MRVAVVGAGIVGVSTAEWLRRDGHEVTLIDRVRPGDPGQASWGNAGVLAASSSIPVSVPGLVWKLPGYLLSRDAPLHLHWGSLARSMPWLLHFLWNGRRTKVEQVAKALAPLIGDTVEQHLALSRGTDAASFVRSANYTAIYRNRAAFKKDAFVFGLRRSLGSNWDEWDRATLNAHEPELSGAYGFAASFRDHGFISSPAGYVAALAEHFEREGGRFLPGEAVDIVPCEGGGAAVTLSDGARHQADRVVLAAGVWSTGLARHLGYKTAMVAERGLSRDAVGRFLHAAWPDHGGRCQDIGYADGRWAALRRDSGGGPRQRAPKPGTGPSVAAYRPAGLPPAFMAIGNDVDGSEAVDGRQPAIDRTASRCAGRSFRVRLPTCRYDDGAADGQADCRFGGHASAQYRPAPLPGRSFQSWMIRQYLFQRPET